MDEPATNKQLDYIRSLVTNNLNFLFEFEVEVTDDEICGFLNENYSDWLSSPVFRLSDLDKADATEIIGRLSEGLE